VSQAATGDTSKKWSINDPTFGARTIEEIAKFSTGKKFNCKAKPLFDFIPMDHVIIDTLHLFLRISDVLIELLIRELRRSDAIEKKKKTCSLMDSLEISINTWQVMKNLSKVLESLLTLESTRRVKSWNIEILLDQTN